MCMVCTVYSKSVKQFQNALRINVVVMPYHFGEVIVQHYNSLLCLSKISQLSDGVLLFDNEVRAPNTAPFEQLSTVC